MMDAPTLDLLPTANARTSVAATFDYSDLPPEVADRQRSRAERIASLKRRTVETMGEIGRELLEAHDDLGHGAFLRWVESVAGLSKSTAYRFMDVSKAFGDELPTLGSLPVAVVQKLAERSTPAPVRAAALRRAKAGEVLEPDAILEDIRTAKEAERERAAAERETARRAALSEAQRAEEDALRARGEKGRAARERKDEREREARNEQDRTEKAKAAPYAAFLVDRLGPDAAAALFHSQDAALNRAIAQAGALAQARRAAGTEATEISALAVDRFGALSEYRRDRQAEAEAEALAERIRAGEAIEPIAVAHISGRQERYTVAAGHVTFRALVDVLKRSTIPVRIAPPIAAETVLRTPKTPAVAPSGDAAVSGSLDEAARIIVSAMGGRGAGVIDALYTAGVDDLAEAITTRLDASNRRWPDNGLGVAGQSPECSHRGRVTADLADLIRTANHVATVLPDMMMEAIEVEAWGERVTASGGLRAASTFLEWATSPEGIGGTHRDRIVTMLEFAMCALDSPTHQDRALDRTCNRKPGERRRYAERALETFEELAGVRPGDAGSA